MLLSVFSLLSPSYVVRATCINDTSSFVMNKGVNVTGCLPAFRKAKPQRVQWKKAKIISKEKRTEIKKFLRGKKKDDKKRNGYPYRRIPDNLQSPKGSLSDRRTGSHHQALLHLSELLMSVLVYMFSPLLHILTEGKYKIVPSESFLPSLPLNAILLLLSHKFGSLKNCTAREIFV